MVLSLFEGYGIELEYMIARASSLDVYPVTDQVIHAACGAYESEIERGDVCWSNELVLHVIELKTNGPAPALEGLAAKFHASLADVNGILAGLGGRLLPGAMHPWMDPFREMKLWPHEYDAVYQAFDRIFDCRGHGWANLQSMHVNLPFSGDEELGRLHAAIRLLLPIMPALSASSPIMDGRPTGLMDSRLEVYRTNSAKIPSIAGKVIPERVYTRADYEREILGRTYRDIAPHDPDGVLQHEFLNARGAIVRFDRSAIEIRVLDVQEHPKADLAIAAAIVAVLKALVARDDLAAQQAWEVEPLHAQLLHTIRHADQATVEDPRYLAALGLDPAEATRTGGWTAGQLWARLLDRTPPAAEHAAALDTILREGPLARRLTRALGPTPTREHLTDTWRALADALETGALFPG